MDFQRVNGHSVSRLTVHIVWATKYRYAVLQGDIKICFRAILIQICEAEGVQILKGLVSKDHIHMHIEYRPSLDVSTLVKLIMTFCGCKQTLRTDFGYELVLV
jgi:putative transposase